MIFWRRLTRYLGKMLGNEVGAFNMNQFAITNNIGLVMNPGANVIQAQVLPTLATTSYYSAGLVVSFGTSTGDMPIIQAVTGGASGIGIIVYNLKTDKYYANQIVGVALDGSIITVSAATTIMRNQVVAYGSTTSNIPNVTPIGSGSGIGVALDTASAAGDIIRILVKSGIAYNASL